LFYFKANVGASTWLIALGSLWKGERVDLIWTNAQTAVQFAGAVRQPFFQQWNRCACILALK